MSFRKSSRRRAPLQFQTLEARENPAANITTLVSGGVLTLTGTDESEAFTITPTGTNQFIITGVNGTQIDGATNPVTTAAATSVKMVLKGGDDVASIDSSAAFALTGALSIDGGDGNNTANVFTTGMNLPVSLGSFTYLGGEGGDTVNIGQSEATSATTITGALSVTANNGGTDTVIENATVGGDLTVKAGIGEDDLTLTKVTASKNVNFDAGFGAASLTASAATAITGGLSYKALDGADAVDLADTTVSGKTGVTIAGGIGAVSLTTGGTVGVPAAGLTVTGINGQTTLNALGTLDVFGDLKVNNLSIFSLGAGPVKAANVSLTAGDSVVVGGTWNVKKNLTLAAASPAGGINANFATLNVDGNVTATGTQTVAVAAANGTVKGSASLTSKSTFVSLGQSPGGGDLEFQKAVVVKGAIDAFVGGNTTGKVTFQKDVSLTGTYRDATANFSGLGNVVFNGKLTVTGGNIASLNMLNAGTATTFAGDVTLSATRGNAGLFATGGGKAFSGNVTLKGYGASLNQSSTTTVTTYAKNLTVNAGNGNDTVLMNGLYSVTGDATFNLGEGTSAVILTSDTAATDFAGKLTVKTGNGDDTTTIVNVQTAKDVSITSLAGIDVVYVDGSAALDLGSVMSGLFTADLGAGDDIVDLGRAAGLATKDAATFNGKVTIKTGAGNDTLFLGRSAGDAHSVAVFTAAGSTIDGGTGFNSYDDELGQGIPTNPTLPGFSDPTP